MGKIVKTVGLVAGAVALTATGVGAIAGASTLIAGLTAGSIATYASVAAGASALLGATVFKPKVPKVPAAQIERLSPSFDPNAFRKSAFGSPPKNMTIDYMELDAHDRSKRYRTR